MKEAKFVPGLFVKAPNDKAPDFVKGSISLKTVDLMQFLQGSNDDWINLDIKVSREGKWYAQINDWKPENGQHAKPKEDEFNDSIPF